MILCLTLMTSSGCEKPVKPEASFYYWKTTFNLTEIESQVLKDNQVAKIYVRYFDIIIKDKNPVPVSPVHFKDIPVMDFVPVVFVKNDVFLQSSIDLDGLAGKTLNLIDQISLDNQIRYSEFQVDCDWTINSKKQFFRFIELLKEKSSKNISATIRLHQVKYFRQTGIPPVDKGVLMYYNMGKIASDTLNSIYERGTAQGYIKSLKNYPLSLDIALPIYSWAIHIRNNKVINLINKVDKDSFISDSSHFLYRNNFFYARDNYLKSGSFFEKGDQLKIESVPAEALKEMCYDLGRYLSSAPNEVIFYDLDEFNLKNFTNEKFFQKICNLF